MGVDTLGPFPRALGGFQFLFVAIDKNTKWMEATGQPGFRPYCGGTRLHPSRATRETPFFLVYGAEACLPSTIIMDSPWVQSFDESMQEQLRRKDMDFINERS
jgi:hypothetical protein